MNLKETLDLLAQYPRIKTISVTQEQPHGITTVEFYPPMPQVQASTVPSPLDIPPDDVMLFAATEDIDDLMKGRKPE